MTDGIYLSPQNFSNLFRQMTITAILSVGMVLVIVAGHIDLSVGKLAGFVSVVVAYFQAYYLARHIYPTRRRCSPQPFSPGRTGCRHAVRRRARVDHRLLARALLHHDTGQHVDPQRHDPDPHRRKDHPRQPALVFRRSRRGICRPRSDGSCAGIVAVLLFILMFNGQTRKAKYGFTLPPLWQDLLKTSCFPALVFGYVFMSM